MGFCTTFPLGRSARYFAVLEAVGTAGFGKFLTNESDWIQGGSAAIGGFAPLSFSVNYEQERRLPEVARDTRSEYFGLKTVGKASVSWDMECLAFTAQDGVNARALRPDIYPFIQSAVGLSSTNNGGANTKFTPQPAGTNDNCLDTMNVYRVVPGSFGEHLSGVAVDSMSINVSGGDDVKFSFSGMAYKRYQVGAALLATNMGTAQTDVETTANGNAWNFPAPGTNYDATTYQPMVSIDVGTDAGKVKKITANDYSGEAVDITLESTTGAAGTDTTSLVPFPSLSPLLSGSALSSISGTLSVKPCKLDVTGTQYTGIEFTDLPLTSLSLTINNQIKPIDDLAFEESAFAGFAPGFRTVEGTLAFKLRKEDAMLYYARRDQFQLNKVVVTLGTTAHKKIQITMNFCEWGASSLSVPVQDEITVDVPFRAISDASGNENDIEILYV